MSRPKLLDLFCCEGGASEGYRRAGFDVYGVDLFEDYTQKRYPFPSAKMNALNALVGELIEFTNGEVWTVEDFDAIAASPPCQRYSITNASRKHDYPDLIGPVRQLLRETGKPYVIENVEGAPLESPVMLCGRMFGLSATDDDGTHLVLDRHRLFESNVALTPPPHPKHGDEQVAGVYGGARRDKWEAKHVRGGGYVPPNKAVAQELLGIDWMTWKGMHQSIPPAYTEYIGTQFLAHVARAAA
jgi:DNA (cytosine-5)-methyltransferase 1